MKECSFKKSLGGIVLVGALLLPAAGLSQMSEDMDFDRMPDFWEAMFGCMDFARYDDPDGDYDGDGLRNIAEYYYYSETYPINPDPCMSAPDNDTPMPDMLPDWWEERYMYCGFDPFSYNDPFMDFDGDSIPNFQEYLNVTDPCAINTFTGLDIAVLSLAGESVMTVMPGEIFTVRVDLDMFESYLLHYRFKLSYPKEFIALEWVEGAVNDFSLPMFMEDPGTDFVEIWDDNASGGQTTTGLTTLAVVTFRMLPHAPPGIMLQISLQPDIIIVDTSGTNFSDLLPPYQEWGTLMVGSGNFGDYQGPVGVQGFLDLNQDFDPTEQDAIILHSIMRGEFADATYIANNARNCDINGNGIFDPYDVGRFDALIRPVRLIHAGGDGICQTYASGDDLQEIPVGRGEPNVVIINGGSDGILQTSPCVGAGGTCDDVVSGQRIVSGDDGVAHTTACLDSGSICDDVQVISVNEGQPDALCISPGPNHQMESAVEPGDVLWSESVSFTDRITSFPQLGSPAKLVPISPVPDTGIIYYMGDIRPVPITVAVLDRNNRPKAGISPDFTVITPGGFFQGADGTSFSQIQTDLFGDVSGPVTGQVTAMFMPQLGMNEVQVSLQGDPAIGVSNQIDPLTFQIMVELLQPPPPESIQVYTSQTGIYAGDTLTVYVELLDAGSQPVHGLGDQISLLTNRNIEAGIDPQHAGDDLLEAAYFGDFESGSLDDEGWSYSTEVNLITNGDSAGAFGHSSVMLPYNGLGDPYLYRTVDTAIPPGFLDIYLSYQWMYEGALPGGTFYTEYSTNGGTTWRIIDKFSFETAMPGMWQNEKYSLKSDSAVNFNATGFQIRFRLNGGTSPPPQMVFLDNILVSGKKALFRETFEGYGVGDFPGSTTYAGKLRPSGYILTGPDGILQTPVDPNDEAPWFSTGQGQPFSTIILPGTDMAIDPLTLSGLTGDDEYDAAAETINSGINGVAETQAQGNDYQEIPVGEGAPWSMAILAGPDLFLDSAVLLAGDDWMVGESGQNPRIEVDSTIWPSVEFGQGNKGSTNFLFMGRSSSGPDVDPYSVLLHLDLGNMEQAKLIFYSKCPNQVDFALAGQPAQEFSVEVSDNGGLSWVKVWDYVGVAETTWTKHTITFNDDDRFNLVDDFLVRWRATMDGPEDDDGGGGPDGVYLDDLLVTGVRKIPDQFGEVTEDYLGGKYFATMTTLVPGATVEIIATYQPEWVDEVGGDVAIFSGGTVVSVDQLKAEPGSIHIFAGATLIDGLTNAFTLKACKSMNVKVMGRLVGDTIDRDLTSYFRLIVNGPARETTSGLVVADCFLGTETIPIWIRAEPRVPGLYDPGGGGGGGQTGDVSGTIYEQFPTKANNAPVWIDIGGGDVMYTHTNATGSYLLSDVPEGSGYVVESSIQGKTKKTKDNVTVNAGENTTVSFALNSGANFDGDTLDDECDDDKDGDGISSSAESSNGSSDFDPDSDGDGTPDDTDACPGDSTGSVDADGDSYCVPSDECDSDAYNWTATGCASCADNDGDHYGTDCDYGPDCDDSTTTGTSCNTGCSTFYLDSDGDGYGTTSSSISACSAPSGYAGNTTDCNDGNSLVNPGETEVMCDSVDNDCNAGTLDDQDGDSDGINYCQELTYGTSDSSTDTDGDGLGDYLEAVTVSCLAATTADTDGDGLCDGATTVYDGATLLCSAGENLDGDSVVDASETDPCDSDSDDDTIPDGYEKTNGLNPLTNDASGDLDGDSLSNLAEYTNNTYANDWDSDDDLLPDGFEVMHSGDTQALDPLNLNDGATDFDGDGNANKHEYWNGSDPWTAEPTGEPGCRFWADSGAGEGIMGPGDLTNLEMELANPGSGDYSGVIPNNADTQELSGEGIMGPGDLTLLERILKNEVLGSELGSRPSSLTTTHSPGSTVSVGSTCSVTVQVGNTVGGVTPGFGVVFEIDSGSAGSAILMGGDGDSVSGGRYDISNDHASGGKSTIYLKVTDGGTISINASIPQCGGGAGGSGRSCAAINLTPAATFYAEE